MQWDVIDCNGERWEYDGPSIDVAPWTVDGAANDLQHAIVKRFHLHGCDCCFCACAAWLDGNFHARNS
jgi:hypothetical protein